MSDLLVGRIVAAHGRHYVVVTESGQRLVCFTRGKKSEAACGDQVDVQDTGSGQGVIAAIRPRRNLLSRSNSFRTKLVAANLDQLAIVVATSPPFSDELLGRTLVAANSIAVPVRILLNKIDLVDRVAAARETLALYASLGYAVDEISVKTEAPLARATLMQHFAGRTTLLVGQSGMGKSSLLNLLVPDAQAAIREISEALQTGKHTTTDARLYRLEPGDDDDGTARPHPKSSPNGEGVTKAEGALIDTPGFQEFGLAHLTPGTIERAFPEIRPFLGQCRFVNCMHLQEPGCAILEARDRGNIESRRYDLFAKLTRESSGFRDR
ncbi:MAG: ribosome small subunit-dependent GTPase A [Burkholderiaceae bacterium]